MTYEQAFHTCCRGGLSGPGLGFQYRAASAGLDAERLAALSRVMVGYVPASTLPPTPGEAELARFPVSLRYATVPGQGTAVSRTVYVGREDRDDSGGGQGRFGNYFSHVLTPTDRGAAWADEPVRLWNATFWQTAHPAETPIATLASPLHCGLRTADIEAVFADQARRAWLPALFDATTDIIAGRARLVVLDDATHGFAWVAAFVLVLPRFLRPQLTFDTYDGEPDRSPARICVSDPAADRSALHRRVHTGEVILVDPAQPAPVPATMLGRVVASALADPAARSLVETAETVEPVGELVEDFAGALAVQLGGAGVEPVDLPVVLRLLEAWSADPGRHGREIEQATATLEALFDRLTGVPDADPPIVVRLLRRLSEAGVGPVGALVKLLLMIEEHVDSDDLFALPADALDAGDFGTAVGLMTEAGTASVFARRLRLLGVLDLLEKNVALDRRAARAAAIYATEPETSAALGSIAESHPDVVGRACTLIAASFAEDTSRPRPDLLRGFAAEPLFTIVRDLSKADSNALLLLCAAELAGQPGSRRRILASALSRFDDEALRSALVEIACGPAADRPPDAVIDLLDGYATAEVPIPRPALDAGWRQLEGRRLSELDPEHEQLLARLRQAQPDRAMRPIETALSLRRLLRDPARAAQDSVELVARATGLEAGHRQELVTALAGIVVDAAERGENASADAALLADRRFGSSFICSYVDELEQRLDETRSPRLVAQTHLAWRSKDARRGSAEQVEAVMADAVGLWRPNELEAVGEQIAVHGSSWASDWEYWLEEHPPSGAVGRAVGRVRRRNRR